jgi:hypothetical protein
MNLRALGVCLSVIFASPVLLLAAPLSCSAASAQTTQQGVQLNITTLLNTGYKIVAASSNGASQFLYLQGANKSGQKKAYACQFQFGSNGGFQGCLVLP